MHKKLVSVLVGVALLVTPLLVSAQTTDTSDASIMASLTALIQVLTQELQQLIAAHTNSTQQIYTETNGSNVYTGAEGDASVAQPSIVSVNPQPAQVGSQITVYFTNGGENGSVILKTLDGSKSWHIPYYTTGIAYNGFAYYDGSKITFTVPSTIGAGQLPENSGYEAPVAISSGTYNLTVYATGCPQSGTCWAKGSTSDVFPITINAGSNPGNLSANCSGSPYNAGTPGISWGSTPSGGAGPYSYQWTLSNDNISTGISGTSADLQQQNLLATYSSAGTKSATVVVSSADQSVAAYCSATIVANLTATPISGPAPISVTFTGVSGTVHFGDGGSAGGVGYNGTTHIYTTPGTYTATSGNYSVTITVTGTTFTPGNLIISTAQSSPNYSVVAGGTPGELMGIANITNPNNEPITITNIGLSMANGTYPNKGIGGADDVQRAYLYQGSMLLGTASFIGNLTTTSYLFQQIVIPANSSASITVKADIAGVGKGQSGGPEDLVKVDVVSAFAGVNNSSLGVTSTGRTNFAGVSISGAALSQCPANATAQRGLNGQTFKCVCPSAFSVKTTWSDSVTGNFADDSDICTAGAQVGEITPSSGGEIDYTIVPGQSSYSGGNAFNGIFSQSYGAWPGSFQITGPEHG